MWLKLAYETLVSASRLLCIFNRLFIFILVPMSCVIFSYRKFFDLLNSFSVYIMPCIYAAETEFLPYSKLYSPLKHFSMAHIFLPQVWCKNTIFHAVSSSFVLLLYKRGEGYPLDLPVKCLYLRTGRQTSDNILCKCYSNHSKIDRSFEQWQFLQVESIV